MEKISAFTDRVTEAGEWRPGNPATGQQATPMLADHFNMVQRELLGVLVAAGIEPAVNDDNQLAKSIWAMLRSATAQASELLRGVLRVGTQVEVNAGALDNVAVSPKKLRLGFASSFLSNGYVAFPAWLGGLVIQWGAVTVSAINGNWQSFSYPIRFPSACFQVVGGRDALGSSAVMLVGKAGGDPAGQVIFQNYAASAEIGKYLAIGY